MDYSFTRFIETHITKGLFRKGLVIAGLIAGLSFSANAQYCVPIYDLGCGSGDDLNSFELTGQGASTISDLNTGCGPGNGYEDRTVAVPAVDLMQGGTYNGTVSTNFSGDEYCVIWIDFDNNQVFDASEQLTPTMGPFGSFNPQAFSITLPFSAPVGVRRMRVRVVFAEPSFDDPCGPYFFGETHDYLVNILAAPPCGGTPAITSISPAGPVNTCAGVSQTLTVSLPVASGYSFQWQQSLNGGATWTSVGPNSNVYTFTVTGTAMYRAYVTCIASALSDTSAAVTVNATPPVYAAVPYFQDFENWVNYCALSDVPDGGANTNWTNNPATGDASWRREDEGWTAGWNNTWGAYFPSSVSGLHSARFASANGMIQGDLDLYLDCSGQTGGKALYFYHINDGMFNWGDSLAVWLSTNGGSTFSQIGSFDTAMVWKKHSLPIASNSAQTILRFRGKVVNWDFTDIGIDSVYIAAPCSGQPVAGTISPAGPISGCPGYTYALSTLGASMAGDLSYQWQQSTDGGVTWNTVPGGGINFNTPVLYDTTHFRLIVTCVGSGLSDTTATVVINIAAPEYATLPYFQDFENWVNYCATSDVPDGATSSWTNTPASGDNSWRRDDEGFTAPWSSPFGIFNIPSVSGLHSARFPSANGSVTGNLDLFLDCSAQPGNKALYFYHLNDGFSTIGDSLTVWLSTDAGATFSQLASIDTALVWKKHALPIVSNSAQTIVRFQGKVYTFDFSDIGVDSVYVALPCNGAPVAGTLSPAGPVSGCPGGTYSISAIGTTIAGDLDYQWQESTDGGLTWTNTPGGTINFSTPALYDTIQYRLIVTCIGSGLADTTAAVTFNISSPVYATLPYVQDFENWLSYCDVSDVPSFNWLNTPATGDLSWRRDDEGFTANWIVPTSGGYAPPSYTGSHSARFHTWFANWGSWGDLDLFIDCSIPGTKELQFHYINPSGSDEIQVWLSEDGGQTFNQLQSVFSTFSWTQVSIPILSNAAETVIRFRAVSDFSDDMGLDNIKVLLPCAGTPDAGVVNPHVACPAIDFNLSTTGTTLAGGIAYQWEESPDGINWTSIPGATSAIYTANITTPTWYRLIVTCTNSGISDTTAGEFIDIGSFYYCYCQGSTALFTQGPDVGNLTVLRQPGGAVALTNGVPGPLVNNPNANQVHSNFTTLPITELYRDSSYEFRVTQINSGAFNPSVVAIFIDLDRDGIYHPVDERVFQQTTSNTSFPPQQVNGSFQIPGNAGIGITGMRVVMIDGAFSFPDPCVTYSNGETEDYLVNITYPPCDGSTNAGLAHISDTLLCPGFPVILTDTTYEKFRSGLTWNWQMSTDNVNWTDIPGTDSLGSIVQMTTNVKTWYRLVMHCGATGTSTYSNVVYVNIKLPFFCYCESFANGGGGDLSDIGAFSIGNYIFNGGGPHLNNPVAVNPYSYFENPVMTLYADSSYALSAYHIIRNNTQQDAKVTLFIDYNNNFVYEAPAERVWTGFTSATDIFINSNVTIPGTAVTHVLTGMRLIINNDTGPNVPSDEACGTYFSGETEDYAVKIMPKGSLGVGSVGGAGSFSIYPNPSTGRVTIQVEAATNKMLQLRVTNITGQQVLQRSMEHPGRAFTTEIDLGDVPRGVYFVELSAGGHKAVKKLILQ